MNGVECFVCRKTDDQVNGRIWEGTDNVGIVRNHWISSSSWWRWQGQGRGGFDRVGVVVASTGSGPWWG